MTTKDKIRAEIKKLQDIFVETAQGMETEDEATVYSMCAVEFGDELLSFLDTLGAETSYDTLQYNPSPSVDIGDVARVQFASHAKVFDKKRKAVFDWEQFKEVAGIFYGFGQRNNTLSEEPVSDCHDLEEAAENSWVDYEYREDPRGLYSSCYVDGFKAGAKWQKAKMMEWLEGKVNLSYGVATDAFVEVIDKLKSL